MVNVCESVVAPSDTVTVMSCMPFCALVGVQANTPVVVSNEEPVGRPVALYVRLLAGVSESVALMSSLNSESSGIVWFCICSSTGGNCDVFNVGESSIIWTALSR